MATKTRQTGQAILEFALMITVLLMIIFLIVEAARILWAWNQVQNAAREGARYASTGQVELEHCAVENMTKFEDRLCLDNTDPDYRAKLRTASIVEVTHNALTGMSLDEDSRVFEDDNFYDIQVYGATDENQWLVDFGGMPTKPVVVRVMYRVPIITPFFRPIAESVPIFGQVTVNNEYFGQLGGSGQGAPQPVQITTPLPTVGVTPSHTPTASNTPPGVPPTEIPSPAPATETPLPPPCNVSFEAPPVAGNRYVYISSDIGTNVTVQILTTGEVLGIDIMQAQGGHTCDGFSDFINGGVGILSQPLVAGDVLLAEGDNGTYDYAFVLAVPPTSTPIPTNTPTTTATPIPTDTPEPTATPSQPYIVVRPSCGNPSFDDDYKVRFNVSGYNWPKDESIALYWDDTIWMQTVSQPHSGSFSKTWERSEPEWGNANWVGDTYIVKGVSSSKSVQTTFQTPCDDFIPPIATPPTPTATPAPADLIVVGQPQIVSTGTPVAYQPIDFSVIISNTGDIPVNNLFFIDLYIDPTPVISTTYAIPVSQSSGYTALSSLAGKTSQAITITTRFGFKNEPDPHLVYAMVDSLEDIDENIEEGGEENNISSAAIISGVQTAVPPTSTPVAVAGGNKIHGVTWRLSPTGLTPVLRARMYLIGSDDIPIPGFSSGTNGYYAFSNIADGDYTVQACFTINGVEMGAKRTGIKMTGSTVMMTNLLLDSNTPCADLILHLTSEIQSAPVQDTLSIDVTNELDVENE